MCFSKIAFIFGLVRDLHRIFPLVFFLVLAACSRDPSPEAFLAPVFEQVSLDERMTGEVTITCRMSSMSQLTEFGLYVTADREGREDGWTQVRGTKTGGNTFSVCLKGLEPGRTYAYRLYIANGREEVQSAANYYTVPE